jgi:hypothetical protein
MVYVSFFGHTDAERETEKPVLGASAHNLKYCF